MRINFDKEAIDYLVNDMTYVFRERQYIIDSNQVFINIFKLLMRKNYIIGKNNAKF